MFLWGFNGDETFTAFSCAGASTFVSTDSLGAMPIVKVAVDTLLETTVGLTLS